MLPTRLPSFETDHCLLILTSVSIRSFQVLESMNMILVVGLAVDYVVHLAQAYAHSPEDGRRERTQHALEQMGVSVMSGAGTTLGASAFMMLADFVFFHQFGVILFATIGFSFVYSMGLFMTVLAMVGPQGETGSTRTFWLFLVRTYRGTKQTFSERLSFMSTSSKSDRSSPSSEQMNELTG